MNYKKFCRRLPPDTLKVFKAIQSRTLHPRGSTLFAEGERASGIFLLWTGRVELSISDLGGKKVPLRIAQPEEILGLYATVSGTPYIVTAETICPSQVSFVKRDDFIRFLRGHREFAFLVVRSLSADVAAAFGRVHALQRKRRLRA